MNFELLLILLIFCDIAVFAFAVHFSLQRKSAHAAAAAMAFGVAAVFSPGVLIGHGIMLFPALPSMIFQPESAPLNMIPFSIVFGISYGISYLWRQPQATRNEKSDSVVNLDIERDEIIVLITARGFEIGSEIFLSSDELTKAIVIKKAKFVRLNTDRFAQKKQLQQATLAVQNAGAKLISHVDAQRNKF